MAISAGNVQSELILDTNKYMTALQKAGEQMKSFEQKVKDSASKMESSLSRVDKQYKLWELSSNGLEKAMFGKGKQVDSLKQKMGLLEKEIASNNQELETARQKFGENSKEAKALEDNILDLKIQHAELNKELEKFNFGNRLKEAGNKVAEVGQTLTSKLTLPILGVGTAATITTGKFDDQMSRVKAISGATGDGFEKLRQQAKDLGRDTRFSASQAAEGMENLASAGFEVNEIMDAMPGMLDLAAAGGVDLAMASDIAASTLRGFGMAAKDAGHVADVLARAAADTNAEIPDLGEGMKYIAPVAKAMGVSLEDTAAAMGLLANAGIKGSMGGTVLRGALARLAKPSKQAADEMDRLGIKAFDANGKMLPLPDLIKVLQESTAGFTEEQKANTLATLFGQEALSGMMALIEAGPEEMAKLSIGFKDSSGAASQMAKTMEDNAAGSWRSFMSALEGAAIAMGDVLIPMVRKLTDWLTGLTRWFAQLNPETQETIVKIGLVAAAIGPLLIIGGKLAAGIGSIISLFGMFSGGAAAATAAAGGATAGAGGLGAALAVLSGPIGWTIAGLAALTVGGIALYNHLKKDSIPTVDLFGKEVSSATKEAVGSFMELNDKATTSLKELAWSGKEVTKEMADSIAGNFSEMAQKVQAGLDKHHQESLSKIQGFINSSTSLSKSEQEQILGNMQNGYEQKKKQISEGEAEIKRILEAASNEKRGLTQTEQYTINRIQQNMVDTGIRVLSENEIEAKAIMERMKQQAGAISSRQAADVVKNSLAQKEGAIKAAEDQYNEVVKEIIRQRDEAGTISAEQADKLIKEATRQRDESVKRATEMHNQVIEQAKKQAGEHVSQVDWETGQIKSRWQVLWEETAKGTTKSWQDMKSKIEQYGGGIKGFLRSTMDTSTAEWRNNWEAINKLTGGKLNDMANSVRNKMAEIKDRIANSKLAEAWDKIWNFKLPKIKLPHFSLKGDFSLMPPRVPSVSVQWYKKGAIFTKPTIFDTVQGLKGVGEAGAEAVLPIEKLSDIFADTMKKVITNEARLAGTNITINFDGSYTFGDKNDIDYFMNEAANIVKRRLG